MDKVFAIGDIHGENNRFQKMLTKWNPDNQQLILLGDLVDRGEDAYGVVHLAKQLHDKYGAIVLKGNHEELFLSWLDSPFSEMDLYYPQGGRETLRSFFGSNITFTHMPDSIADMVKTQFVDEVSFLKDLPYYYEWNNHVFVHAGVDLMLPNWKDTETSDFCWIRRDFHYKPNHTGKIFVFGHTITNHLNPGGQSTDVWISPCQSKIGIDGGAVFGGQLHAVAIDGDQHTFYSLDKELHFQQHTKTIGLATLNTNR
ncbi:serine/threonine protein phosphatase [Bacillus sp. M6-12]|uniref:metallophosphoesterase n=1 Tax=Bacillus sp. M6-12 TaxID=2054166 RepID=UPI000C7819B4|nr:metallophosphoesterase [Bacillus sp. M6-12]PLS19432.1 serine/threonine protein phosphatase [Bacillus sp. M6-12]